MTAASTAASSPRLASLDVVRGIAVLGILAANIAVFGQPFATFGWPGGFLAPPGPLADWLWGAQLVLVDGKFRGLFTLLFGAGLVLFLRNAEAHGAGYLLLARRLLWLGVFGLLHWALLWRGDILLTYAVAGVFALPFLKLAPHRQFALGLAGYLVGAALLLALLLAVPAFSPSAVAQMQEEATAEALREAALVTSGDYAAIVADTLARHLGDLPATVLSALFETVPLVLIGTGLLGAGVFDGAADSRRQLAWGAGLWLAGTAATALIAALVLTGGVSYWDSLRAAGWAAFPALAASLGLIALLALWGRRATGWLARCFADAGRCAFSNYIGTSALALVVFSGWGLGLFGKLGRLELYGVMLVFWVLMLAWPGWWLARFRHGPLEWLWRSLTYGERVPFRR